MAFRMQTVLGFLLDHYELFMRKAEKKVCGV